MKKLFLLPICIISLMFFSTHIIAAVRPVTMFSSKSDNKFPEVLFSTQTEDNILDFGSLFMRNNFRVILNKLKADIGSTGIGVDELKFKADELSLDPKGDFKNAIAATPPIHAIC